MDSPKKKNHVLSFRVAMLAALNLQDWIDFTPFFTSLDFKIRTNQGALRSMELEEVYKESPASLYLAFFSLLFGL